MGVTEGLKSKYNLGPIEPLNRARSSPTAKTTASRPSIASSSSHSSLKVTRTRTRAKVPAELRSIIEADIVEPDRSHNSFDDVVGMRNVKDALKEMVVLPMLRPDLFQVILVKYTND